jgi:hypothetical protein
MILPPLRSEVGYDGAFPKTAVDVLVSFPQLTTSTPKISRQSMLPSGITTLEGSQAL